jgi:peroxiredoxin
MFESCRGLGLLPYERSNFNFSIMSLPQVDFVFRENGEFVTRTTFDIFKGKRSVIFALPGAFTPTCSEQQLPGFEAAYDEIKALGVDEVYCLSVNDAFVMNAWAESLGIKKVKMIPDGNGAFTVALKSAVAKTNLGFGTRSWRLALIVNENAVVEWAGIEEGQRANASDDPYERSTPEAVMAALRGIQVAQAAAAVAEEQALADVDA